MELYKLTVVATVKEKFTKKDGKLKFIRCDQNEDLVTDSEAVVLLLN